MKYDESFQVGITPQRSSKILYLLWNTKYYEICSIILIVLLKLSFYPNTLKEKNSVMQSHFWTRDRLDSIALA